MCISVFVNFLLHSSQKPWVDIFPYFHMIKTHCMVSTFVGVIHINWYRFMDITVLVSRVQYYNQLTGNFLFPIAKFQFEMTTVGRFDTVLLILLLIEYYFS
jgi:hypothetical protein